MPRVRTEAETKVLANAMLLVAKGKSSSQSAKVYRLERSTLIKEVHNAGGNDKLRDALSTFGVEPTKHYILWSLGVNSSPGVVGGLVSAPNKQYICKGFVSDNGRAMVKERP